MTAIARMPDGAAGNGIRDDTADLQAMFNACPNGGLCIIPDGIFRVTNTIQPNKPMTVWCSPGAHIKGDFGTTQPVVWAFWHTPNGTYDQYVTMPHFHWQGGTISRLNKNGACFRGSAWWNGCIQGVKTLRGTPHIWLDAPDSVSPGYWTGGYPNYSAVSRIVNCHGYEGGPIGFKIGQSGAAQSNGHSCMYSYFEGDNTSGSVGADLFNGSATVMIGCTLKNYQRGVRVTSSNRANTIVGTRMIGIAQPFFGSGSTVTATTIHPRGWQGGRGTGTWKARDSLGVYL